MNLAVSSTGVRAEIRDGVASVLPRRSREVGAEHLAPGSGGGSWGVMDDDREAGSNVVGRRGPLVGGHAGAPAVGAGHRRPVLVDGVDSDAVAAVVVAAAVGRAGRGVEVGLEGGVGTAVAVEGDHRADLASVRGG